MPYLFDTNLWIQLLKKRAPVAREKINHLSTNEIVTCSIVKAELWHGSWKYDFQPSGKPRSMRQLHRTSP